MKPTDLYIKEFDYTLPPEQIAHHPLPARDASRLLVYREGVILDKTFSALPGELPPGTLLVFNNTRVIEARLFFQKPTGGVIEIFCLEPAEGGMAEAMQQKEGATWRCLIGGASKWKAGQVLRKELPDGAGVLTARYLEKEKDAFLIRFDWEPAHSSFATVIGAAGAIPLPPYIKRVAEKSDAERYQTIFARHAGSVAAPTASLHFTEAVLEDLERKGIRKTEVTLHVGAGTFKPVKTETVAEHDMHAEGISVSRTALEELIRADKVVAVGTTSLRTLESLYWLGVRRIHSGGTETSTVLGQWEAYDLAPYRTSYRESLGALLDWMEGEKWENLSCATSLIIVPGYQFGIPAGLVTNFHQPQSTLLLLVSAFIGQDWKKVYAHALEGGYRFLSYGDSSLLWRR